MEVDLKPLDLTHNGKREVEVSEPPKKRAKKEKPEPITVTPNLELGITTTKELTGAAKLKYLRDKHRQPVRGIFRYHECPGGLMKFSFMEFKEDGVQDYAFVDGEVYTIPLGVAKHLNKNVCYPEYDYFKDEKTKSTHKVARYVRRVSFQSLEFIDEEDFAPNRILQVTSAF